MTRTMNTTAGSGISLDYGEGWYGEEQDGAGPFRWMGREARCRVVGLGISGTGLVRIAGGLWRADVTAPQLSVSVNGMLVGSATIGSDVADRVFPVELTDPLDVVLALDRIFTVPGDPRALGMMVRAIDVFSPEWTSTSIDAEGWYQWERHEYFPFRWMRAAARLFLPPILLRRGGFAEVPIFTPGGTAEQVLKVSTACRAVAEIPLRHGWHIYGFELEAVAPSAVDNRAFLELTFSLNRLAPGSWHPADPRELGVAVGEFAVHPDRRRHDFIGRFHRESGRSQSPSEPVATSPVPSPYVVHDLPIEGDGWHAIESGEAGRFRWMKLEGRLRIAAHARPGQFCVIPIFSAFKNLAQELTILADGQVVAEWTLMKGWNDYNLALGARGRDVVLTMRLEKLTPYASHSSDPRDLGIRVGLLEFHDDEERHARAVFIQENRTRSQRELLSGATVLSSLPSTLGIDLFGKCNIKPACVYCPWDRMKELEGGNTDAIIDDRTLESYGRLFAGAESLVNCSFGEPLLHPRLEQILELVARHRKTIELSTNGQAFTTRTVQALAGKPVHLYVSLDAATPETYARLRNERWHEILTGLLFLREARQLAGGWPRVNMVFIPMRVNRPDLEAYFRLCRLVDADALVLRPLLMEESHVDTQRGGYRYVYAQEHLGPDDLGQLVGDCKRLSDRYLVPVRTQFDFGKTDFGGIGTSTTSPDRG
jgi:Radical SAM superfamily